MNAEIEEYRLTTVDNPYDPFEQFNQWFLFDVERGYNSCAYLGRIARTSEALSDSENIELTNEAIDEILKYNLTGNYIKVKRSDPKPKTIQLDPSMIAS
jgi:hypothetical protein